MPATDVREGGDPFVGRAPELARLLAARQVVATGRPWVVLVRGPAGIGKSALARRFAASSSSTLLTASGDEAEAELPYAYLDQLLPGGPPGASGLAGDSDPWPVGENVEVWRVAQRLLTALGDLAAHCPPPLLVLDDVQWADGPSLRAIAFALRRLQVDAVLTLLLVRDEEEMPARLPEGLVRLAQGDRGETVHLAGLSAADLVTLAEQLGLGPLSRSDGERLVHHTGGHPLHARALLREIPLGQLRAAGEELAAPSSYSMLVLARLAGCSPEVESLVAAAAVLGSVVPLAAAAELAGLGDPLAALEEAIEARLLVEQPGRRIAFRHPMVRAAVYGDLGPARRAALHRAAARHCSGGEALAHLAAGSAGPDDALAAALAGHAGELASAGSALLAAQAWRRAAALFADPTGRSAALLAAATTLLRAGEAGRVSEFAPEVEALPGSWHRSQVLGWLAFFEGRYSAAAAHLAEAWEEAAKESVPATERSTIAGLLAEVALVQSRFGRCFDWAKTSRELDPSGAGLPTFTRGLLAMRTEDPGSDPAGDPATLIGRGAALLWRDALPAARDTLRAALVGAGRGGGLQDLVAAHSQLAHVCYRIGDWDGALAHAEVAESLAEDSGLVWIKMVAPAVAAWVHAARGDADRAAGLADDVARVAGPAPVQHVALLGAFTAAVVAAERGDWARARTALIGFGEPLRYERLGGGVLPWRELQVEALVHLGLLDEAHQAITRCEALPADDWPAAMRAGQLRVRGLLTAARGDFRGAVDQLRAAIEALHQAPVPLVEAEVRLALGQALRRL
ncbi:MAG: AAA family ATPase, partial [Mycobacteriales bacterium]